MYSAAIASMRRGHGLSFTKGSQALRLPESRGLIFTFQFGKTSRKSSEAVVVLAEIPTNLRVSGGSRNAIHLHIVSDGNSPRGNIVSPPVFYIGWAQDARVACHACSGGRTRSGARIWPCARTGPAPLRPTSSASSLPPSIPRRDTAVRVVPSTPLAQPPCFTGKFRSTPDVGCHQSPGHLLPATSAVGSYMGYDPLFLEGHTP